MKRGCTDAELERAVARLKPPVQGLHALTLKPDPDVLELIAARSGVDRSRLEKAGLYVGSRGESSSVRVLSLSLGGEMEGASVALVIDDEGRLLDGLPWGRDDVDKDPNGTWRRIVEQFAWAGIEASKPEELSTGFDPQAYWLKLNQDKSDKARLSLALYKTRRLMIGNSDFYQSYELTTKRGTPPPGAWFESYLSTFDRLVAVGEELGSVLSEAAAATFLESANRVRSLVADMSAVEGPERSKRVQEIFSGMEAACFACHNIRDHELGWDGPLVFPGLEHRLADYGVRKDLFRVGMDVWSPAGEDESSQEIASAVQAALLLVGSSN